MGKERSIRDRKAQEKERNKEEKEKARMELETFEKFLINIIDDTARRHSLRWAQSQIAKDSRYSMVKPCVTSYELHTHHFRVRLIYGVVDPGGGTRPVQIVVAQ